MLKKISRAYRPSASLLLLLLLLSTLWIAGGSARDDELGQVFVQGISALVIAIAVIFGDVPPFRRYFPISVFLLCAILFVLLQLMPLPPPLWQMLPGRSLFSDATLLGGEHQPWRPLAIVPSATLDALYSLMIPAATFILVISVRQEEKAYLPHILLILIAGSAILALLQFAGIGTDNPLINDGPGGISGNFANPNHLALFLSCGLLIAPVWAFVDGKHSSGRVLFALGLIVLFALTILASGSRSGLIVGLLGLSIGAAIVRRPFRHMLSRYPRWVLPALLASLVGLLAILILVSFAADRAVSINRILAIDPTQDTRHLALPTLWVIARTYFPAGYGFGGFDPIFRIHEPFSMLDYSYFNHAHNDLLEIVLEGGLGGVLLLVAILIWWLRASFSIWRSGPGMHATVPKIGSAILLLILVASIFDYPARTPMIMAMVILAGIWLNTSPNQRLPARP